MTLKTFSKFFNSSPRLWGIAYFGAVPIFAFIYSLMPGDWFQYGCESNNLSNFLNSLYFSTITITTLGYGDIYPIHLLSKIIVVLESLFGILSIGFFLNAVALKKSKIDANDEKKNNEVKYFLNEKIKLSRQYVILEPYLKNYIDYAIMVSTPIEKRTNELKYNPEFDFQDLHDLYGPSLRLADSFTEPVISHFYKALHGLETRIESLLSTVDLTLWPDLENLLLRIVRSFRELDHESVILSYMNTTFGGVKATTVQSELIKNWNEKVDYYPSNAINSFVALYNLIRTTVPLAQDADRQLLEIARNRS